jgi:hypothetical protein
MTSIQGTNTNYSPIADTFLYLTLNEDDKEYITAVTQKTFNFFGYPEPDRLSLEKKEEVYNKYIEYTNSLAQIKDEKKENKLVGLLNFLPENITTFKHLVKKFNVDDNNITLFVFKDGHEDKILQWFQTRKPDEWNRQNAVTQLEKELLATHILPFKLYPSQMYKRRIMVETMLKNYNSMYSKIQLGTIGNELFIYPNTIDMVDFPRIKIERFFEYDKGMIYIIESPILTKL